jgi:hypothetical protein
MSALGIVIEIVEVVECLTVLVDNYWRKPKECMRRHKGSIGYEGEWLFPDVCRDGIESTTMRLNSTQMTW